MRAPNLLLILTDQHLAGTLGCYGSTLCRTPNLDALAREAIVFDNAYAAAPICTPARASLQTGLLPFRHGMQTNIYNRGCMVHELPDHPSLLPRRLAEAGYRAGFTGKWHLGFGPDYAAQPEYQHHVQACPGLGRVAVNGSLPSTIGYEGDDFPGHGGVGTGTPQYRAWLRARGRELRVREIHRDYPRTYEVVSGADTTVNRFLTERALGHIGGFLEAERPFYYQLNFWGPHADYHAPTEFLDLYRNQRIPPWPSFREAQETKPAIHWAHRTETTRHWSWSEYEECLRVYYASITEIDAQIGRLLDLLRARGALDSTVIVFSADHGDSLGVHGGLTDKALFMYEETNRIPLLVRPAGGTRHRREGRFVGTCDLYSTFLDYAGHPASVSELDGRSLRPLVEGRNVPWRDCIVTECSGLDYLLTTQRALRYRTLKYVFNLGELDELYDLAEDPHELRNLAMEPERSADLQLMRSKLETWLEERGDGLLERFRRIRLR